MLWNKLSDRIFFRTMFSSFGMRPVDRGLQTFIPYFRYEIGPYRTDYFLHFRREPNWDVYKNEIFNKLEEVTGYDVVRYLNFHYESYADKPDFLRFLRYETSVRIKHLRKRFSDWRIKLETVLAWVDEQERALKGPADDPVPVVEPGTAVEHPSQPDETEIEIAEASLKEVAQAYRGRIEVYDERSLDRIIQLLLLVKDLRSPGKPISQLFRKFSQTDIASILLQFEVFKDMKANTLQKRVIRCNKDLRPTDPKTAQLVKALTDFFY